jgi:hypothetical protein
MSEVHGDGGGGQVKALMAWLAQCPSRGFSVERAVVVDSENPPAYFAEAYVARYTSEGRLQRMRVVRGNEWESPAEALRSLDMAIFFEARELARAGDEEREEL